MNPLVACPPMRHQRQRTRTPNRQHSKLSCPMEAAGTLLLHIRVKLWDFNGIEIRTKAKQFNIFATNWGGRVFSVALMVDHCVEANFGVEPGLAMHRPTKDWKRDNIFADDS